MVLAKGLVGGALLSAVYKFTAHGDAGVRAMVERMLDKVTVRFALPWMDARFLC